MTHEELKALLVEMLDAGDFDPQYCDSSNGPATYVCHSCGAERPVHETYGVQHRPDCRFERLTREIWSW